MLDERKIRIMSRCAMYEKGIGKEDLKINKYFQSDYIRFNTLKSLIGVSIAYLLCLGCYVILNAEYYMENIVTMDMAGFVGKLLISYVIVLLIFGVISVSFFTWKYKSTQKRVSWYYRDLKKIDEMTESDEENE